jgi:hypothetical protein
MRFLMLLAIALLPSGTAFSQDDDTAAVQGPVTRIVSSTDFDVSRQEVTLSPKTQIRLIWPDGSSVIERQPVRLFLGEHIAVFQTAHDEGAKRIEIQQPGIHSVDGIATVEAVAPGKDLELRADGYRILIGPETKVKYEKPFATANEVKANAVLKYKGMLQKDGTVLATSATFFENRVSPEMLAARKTWEYDPTTIASESHQSGVSRVVRGTDPTYFPLYADATLQARISRIGERLIPEYQRKLKPEENSWIHFRFYAVDAPKSQEAYYVLPSGIILMPYQATQKLPDDSQLAAVLADAIAGLVEGQPPALPVTNGQIAGTALELAAVGWAGYSIGSMPAARQQHKDAEQRARVSLTLMRDAGFEETAAPTAWWALSRNESMPLTELQPPPAAAYLYERIAEHQAAEAGQMAGKRR